MSAHASAELVERPRYTLDTSAVIAYFTDEPGAAEVQAALVLRQRGAAEVFASFMTFIEVLYRVWQQRGEKEGKLSYLRLKALPVA